VVGRVCGLALFGLVFVLSATASPLDAFWDQFNDILERSEARVYELEALAEEQAGLLSHAVADNRAMRDLNVRMAGEIRSLQTDLAIAIGSASTLGRILAGLIGVLVVSKVVFFILKMNGVGINRWLLWIF